MGTRRFCDFGLTRSFTSLVREMSIQIKTALRACRYHVVAIFDALESIYNFFLVSEVEITFPVFLCESWSVILMRLSVHGL